MKSHSHYRLSHYLKTPQELADFLTACLEISDSRPDFFITILGDIVREQASGHAAMSSSQVSQSLAHMIQLLGKLELKLAIQPLALPPARSHSTSHNWSERKASGK